MIRLGGDVKTVYEILNLIPGKQYIETSSTLGTAVALLEYVGKAGDKLTFKTLMLYPFKEFCTDQTQTLINLKEEDLIFLVPFLPGGEKNEKL